MSPGIESTNSSSFTVPAVTSYRSPGGTPKILVKAPSLGKIANVASLLAAPFTGGASLAANAALRGGLVAAQGVKAARAGKALQAAKGGQTASLANKPVKVRKPRGRGATTQASKRQTASSVRTGDQAQLPGLESVDPTDVGGEPKSTYEAIQERAQEGPQSSVDDPYQETFSTESQPGTMDARMELEQAQSKFDEMNEGFKEVAGQQATPATAMATGAVGVQQIQQNRQAKQDKQRAEMERIERLAEEGRAKASTGSKIAVT